MSDVMTRPHQLIASDRVETEHVLQRDTEAQLPWPDVDAE